MNSGIELDYTLSNASSMVPEKNKAKQKDDEKEWEIPLEPANTSDDRDKEQLLRQYKEAKRRKDNLTEPRTDN